MSPPPQLTSSVVVGGDVDTHLRPRAPPPPRTATGWGDRDVEYGGEELADYHSIPLGRAGGSRRARGSAGELGPRRHDGGTC